MDKKNGEEARKTQGAEGRGKRKRTNRRIYVGKAIPIRKNKKEKGK
jgi:hypothetical protein